MTGRPLFVVSLVLASIIGAVWALSYATHWVGTSPPWSCGLHFGKVKFMYFGEMPATAQARRTQKFDWAGMWFEHEPNVGLWNSDTNTAKNVRMIHFLVPLWMPMALFCAWPAAVLVLRGPLLRRYRRRHGLCVRCGYNLTGNVSLKCPECGTYVSAPPPALTDPAGTA